jgi:hypothetical protein
MTHPVKRYGTSSMECPNGIYVLHSEYEKVAAERDRLSAMVDKLLAHCPDGECFTCGEAVCPHGEPLHFHHDGCPACYQDQS